VWALLRHLAHLHPASWLCLGDFNEIVESSETWGGAVRANNQMVAFRQVLEFYELTDIGYRDPKFTWSNCWNEMEFTKERLDRGVANSEWRGLFLDMELVVEVITCSDHTPLILFLMGDHVQEQGSQNFRYKTKWRREEGYEEILKQAWAPISDMEYGWQGVGKNLSRCKASLLCWQKDNVGDIKERISQLQKRHCVLQGAEDVGVGEEMKLIHKEMEALLEKSDKQWRQRAKIEWLRCGDRNTKFYHPCANARRKSNTIYEIIDAEGRQCKMEEKIQMSFVEYFDALFTSDNVGNILPLPLGRRVSAEMNSLLLQPFNEDEVRLAASSSHSLHLRIQTTFCFPMSKCTPTASLNAFL
jgi:hypothetical protein